VKQPKVLVAVVDCHVIISTSAIMNTMPRRQEWGLGEYEGEESVTAREKFEGNEPLNPNVSYFLTYSMEQSPSSEANRFFSQSRNSPHFM